MLLPPTFYLASIAVYKLTTQTDQADENIRQNKNNDVRNPNIYNSFSVLC